MSVVAPLVKLLFDERKQRQRGVGELASDEAKFWELVTKRGGSWSKFKEYAARDFCAENVVGLAVCRSVANKSPSTASARAMLKMFLEEIADLHKETAKALLKDPSANLPDPFPKILTSREVSNGGATALGRLVAVNPDPRKPHAFWMDHVPSTAAKHRVPAAMETKWRDVSAQYVEEGGVLQLNLPFAVSRSVVAKV
ncbi:hypothetical protein HDU93_008439 [Gonapodya sp. JEL0774]|nr:hypothetical protein HDU93_008439 [Gonapodya sp. JEL0774]